MQVVPAPSRILLACLPVFYGFYRQAYCQIMRRISRNQTEPAAIEGGPATEPGQPASPTLSVNINSINNNSDTTIDSWPSTTEADSSSKYSDEGSLIAFQFGTYHASVDTTSIINAIYLLHAGAYLGRLLFGGSAVVKNPSTALCLAFPYSCLQKTFLCLFMHGSACGCVLAAKSQTARA
jgi:hypothetical protein